MAASSSARAGMGEEASVGAAAREAAMAVRRSMSLREVTPSVSPSIVGTKGASDDDGEALRAVRDDAVFTDGEKAKAGVLAKRATRVEIFMV
mmetsp:Transcript_21742/g.37340  ORF Transcript_21742/g.37340 Transcript_21742/m.37340 type:complete len:92 (+) Transcript_21742:857-1132(+)